LGAVHTAAISNDRVMTLTGPSNQAGNGFGA